MNGVKTALVDGNVVMYKKCTITHKEYSVLLSFPKYVMWREDKKLIQDVFPHLTPDEREFMITGWTPAEWEDKFSEEKCSHCKRAPTFCLCEMD